MITGPLLDLAAQAPVVPLETLSGGGDVVLLAPHPDDETLGCGGTIAALTRRGHRVHVVVITDGSRSHPNSATFPAATLAMTREAEVTEALHILTAGKGPPPVFLRYPDMAAPDGDAAAEAATCRILPLIDGDVTALWATWEGDPHPDHGRTARIARGIGRHRPDLLRWSYPIWGRFRPEDPETEPSRLVRVDVTEEIPLKRRALAAHRSQMTFLVADDPAGFVMPLDVQDHFVNTPELFVREFG